MINRRKALIFGCATLLAGCGDGGDAPTIQAPLGTIAPTPPPVPSPSSQPWKVDVPSFALGSGATFNLAVTLPSNVLRGGKFAVSPSGASLPSGMTLSPAGILAVGTARVGQVQGVIFTYETP